MQFTNIMKRGFCLVKLSLTTKIILILLIGAIIIVPQVLLPHAEFGGADDAAGEAITVIDESYVPWFESIFDPGDMEENLFIFQQVLGVGGLIACFVFLDRKSKKTNKKPQNN